MLNPFKRKTLVSNVHDNMKAEIRIINSGVRNVFTPHTPINKLDHFFGRDNEVKRIVSVISSPGQHILLFGDRGVGKTSLANTTCNLLLEGLSEALNKGKVYSKSCDSSDSFNNLFCEPLKELNINILQNSESKSVKYTGDAGASAGFLSAGLVAEHETNTINSSEVNLNSPSYVAKKLGLVNGVLLLDEVDTLSNPEDKRKIAELIKLLSDSNAGFKIILVGIAKTANELTTGHKSIQRCLKEIHLDRMCNSDIRKIILNGMKAVSKKPSDEVVDKIVDISSGFPHFTHLICLKCAEIAIEDNKTHIEKDILNRALIDSSKDSEGTLSNSLDKMLRNINKPNDYKLLLLTIAHCNKRDFRSREVATRFKEFFGVELTSSTISRRLSKLSEDFDGVKILNKTGKGCYCFDDPRMPSLIKIKFNMLFDNTTIGERA